MKKYQIIFLALIMGMFTVGFLISPALDPSPEKTVCKEASAECCCKRNTTPPPDGMIWQNFSREFLSFIAIPIDY